MKRQLLRSIVLSAIVVSVVVAGAVGGAVIVLRQRAAENVTKLFGGSDGLQTALSAQHVEAYRVTNHSATTDESQQTIGGARIVSGPVAVDAETARALAAILKDPQTYGWDFAKGCKFDPGVAVRFVSVTSTVDVVFCFHCEELQIYLDDKKVGSEDFDAASQRLAAIMKRLFPEDEEIQKL